MHVGARARGRRRPGGPESQVEPEPGEGLTAAGVIKRDVFVMQSLGSKL